MNMMMLNMMVNQMEVAEVYSPPRVVGMANKLGIRGGWSLDLTICDTDGQPSDFNSTEMRNRAIRKLINDRPVIFIGSPMCIEYSTMQRINHSCMAPEEVAQRLAYARKHLEFCIRLYEIQWRSGRYFFHEHPDGAGSWQETMMKRLMSRQGVHRVSGDQCQFGSKSKDEQGIAPARGRIGFFAKAVCVAKRLNKKCPNTNQYNVHRHVILTNGRASAAQVYPDKLCQEICLGIQEQIKRDREGQYLLANVENNNGTTSKGMVEEANKLRKRYKTVEEEEQDFGEEAWDDVYGSPLKQQEIIKARQEEIEYVNKMKLYEKVPTSEAYPQTGKGPISVRWIDINKGDNENPNYRSRFVAREINTSKRNDLFEATPPLEAWKTVLSIAASGNKGEVVMVNDISRAFFHAPAKRKVEEHMCGRLDFSMYGTFDGAQNWFDAYSQQLRDVGSQQGTSSPCTFYNKQRAIRTYAHGDDYVSVGQPAQLKWLKAMLEKQYQVKTQWLGPDKDQ